MGKASTYIDSKSFLDFSGRRESKKYMLSAIKKKKTKPIEGMENDGGVISVKVTFEEIPESRERVSHRKGLKIK